MNQTDVIPAELGTRVCIIDIIDELLNVALARLYGVRLTLIQSVARADHGATAPGNDEQETQPLPHQRIHVPMSPLARHPHGDLSDDGTGDEAIQIANGQEDA